MLHNFVIMWGPPAAAKISQALKKKRVSVSRQHRKTDGESILDRETQPLIYTVRKIVCSHGLHLPISNTIMQEQRGVWNYQHDRPQFGYRMGQGISFYHSGITDRLQNTWKVKLTPHPSQAHKLKNHGATLPRFLSTLTAWCLRKWINIHTFSYYLWTVLFVLFFEFADLRWIKRDQLDVTCFIISLFNAQHVSDVNTYILRSLQLICWVISWVVLLWFDVCWCYVVVLLGWCRIRMQAEACNIDTTPNEPHRNSNTHRTKNNTTNMVIQ